MLRAAVLALALCSALPASAQPVQPPLPDASSERGPGRFLRWAVGDVLAIRGSVTRHHLAYAAAAAGTIALFTVTDAELSGDAGIDHRQQIDLVLDSANELGNPHYVPPVAAGLFAASLLVPNTRLQDAAFTSFQSVVYADLAAGALKGLIGRSRPRHLEGPFEFEPLGGRKSMPSGHTTLAFALTVPWAVYYPGPVTYGLVGLATGTAVSRVIRGDHWPSDVLAGAALGSLTGYLLARRHLGSSSRFDVRLGYAEKRPAVSLRVRL